MAKKSTQVEALDLVVKRFNISRTQQQPAFERFLNFYNLYRGSQKHKNYKGRANLFVPAPYWTVESYVPRVTKALRTIRAVPRKPEAIEQARMISKLFELRQDQMNWRDTFRSWVRNAGIYGTSFLKVGWEFGNGVDRPYVETASIFDVFADPTAKRLRDAKYATHKFDKDFDELDKNIYQNLNKIKLESGGNIGERDEYKLRMVSPLGLTQTQDTTSKKIELLEYWGKYDGEDFLITVANRNTTIRMERNPFADIWEDPKPLVQLYDQDLDDEFYGVGEIEPPVSLFEELNDTRNQRMDNVTLILNRMWEVLRAADISTNDFVSMPGKVFMSNVPNGIREISTPDVTGSSYNEEKIIKEDIQQTAVGTSTINVPNAQKGDTATGILSSEQAGDTRRDDKIENMESAVERVWKKILGLEKKFFGSPVTVRTQTSQGFSFADITPESLMAEVDVDIQVETQQNKNIKKQTELQLFTLASKIPGANIQKHYYDLMEAYDKTDPEQYYTPPQPQPQEPKINIVLRGDMEGMAVDELVQNRLGLSPQSTDPMLRENYRDMVFPEEALIRKSLEAQMESKAKAGMENAASKRANKKPAEKS